MADIFNKPVHIKKNSGPDSVACGSFLVGAIYAVFERLSAKLFEEFEAIADLQQDN